MHNAQTAATAAILADYHKTRQLYLRAAANYAILCEHCKDYTAAQQAKGLPCTADDVLNAAQQGIQHLRRQFRPLSSACFALGLITWAEYAIDTKL